MSKQSLKAIIFSLSCLSVQAPAWANLNSDKSIINKNTGNATITVDFPTAIKGDLYLATLFNGQLYFFGNGGKIFSTEIIAYTTNTAFSERKTVLTIAPNGIPAATYSLFQVVAIAGKNPLEVNNWIGGINGLSELKLRINLDDDLVTPKPTVTPTQVVTPAPTPVTSTPSAACNQAISSKETDERYEKKGGSDDDDDDACKPTPTATPTANGQALYQGTCASSGCHGSNPKANSRNVLKGQDVRKIQDAIQKNKGGVMGRLKDRKFTDAELQAIANYLKTF